MKSVLCYRLLVLAGIHLLICCGAGAQQIEPQTPADRLFLAVESNKIDQVTALLHAGVSPNTPNAFQLRPLVWAALLGRDITLIKLLLDNGANIEATDQLGNTPLLAATGGETYDTGVDTRMAEITLLLDRGANLKAVNNQGETALLRAMQPGHHRIVRLLLDRGADINVTGAGQRRFTPIDYAAFANDTDRVKALLKAGADVDRVSTLGTPLILAAEGGSVPTLQALLDTGTDVNVKQEQFGGFGTALLSALSNGNVEAAQLLIAHGADVNVAVTLNGRVQYTPLTLAFRMQDIPPGRQQVTLTEAGARHTQIDALIGQLLDKGANVNVIANTYEAPLVQAIQRARYTGPTQVDWVKPMLDKGADVNIRLEYLGSPLHAAIDNRRKDLQLPQLLIDHGADVNAVDGANLTVLLGAIAQHDFALAQLLIQRGAKAECFDGAHKTPLMWAAYDGQLDFVQLLLAHGANLNSQDIIGQTAVMLAQKGNHPDVVAFLKSRGGTATAPPTVATNALHHAIVTLPIKWLPGNKSLGPVTFEVAPGPASPALAIRRNGKLIAQPITLDGLFTSTALWAPEERNDNHYQVGRGYYSPDAYQFFGLVTVKNGTYLGVYWYSPAASAENQVADFVFGLRMVGNAIELEIVAKSDANSHQLTRHSDLPKLEKSAGGDLIRIDWDGRYKYLPNGQWTKIGPPSPTLNP